AAMAAQCRLTARFHHVHGANVRLDASRTRATRVESFAHGLCFSQEPLAPGQIFLVEIEEKERGWCGHLRVGLTALDPQHLQPLPDDSLPDGPGPHSHILDELYRTNVLPPTARRSRIGVLYAPQPDGTADMHIVINGEDMGPSARHLPTTRPLYAVVDVFASTKSVRVIPVEDGFPSLQTLCRVVIQKHIVHRVAIDGLDLPAPLKSFCEHE
ncbi:Neuralized-like 2, partial [Cuculus canorus]